VRLLKITRNMAGYYFCFVSVHTTHSKSATDGVPFTALPFIEFDFASAIQDGKS